MQACPYDALYIDPETNTAAKCNYCAHRTEIGLEPACVNVCPEHAIISGDMENPDTEIAQLLSREQVTVRKPEKYTKPNVYYIDGDAASLNPSATDRSQNYIWSSQSAGVGHYAKFAEKLAGGKSLVDMVAELSGKEATFGGDKKLAQKSIEVIMEQSDTKRVYDTPDKGILWGWEVNSYVLTKAIAAGAFLVPFIASLMGIANNELTSWISLLSGLIFLGLTGLLLVIDLDQPFRFAYVLLRPQWRSWLVRGGYAITVFGGVLTILLAALYFDWPGIVAPLEWVAAIFAILVAIYTAFLFAQAKGRDFWQSPTMVLHMLVHSIMGGASLFGVAALFYDTSPEWINYISYTLAGAVIANLVILFVELSVTHPTQDAKKVVEMILKGRYNKLFWIGTLLIGNLIPLVLVFVGTRTLPIAGIFVLIGIYITEKIWIEAPQRIPLT
jgi:formate-dependent nitrite reductase membrane component NrfD